MKTGFHSLQVSRFVAAEQTAKHCGIGRSLSLLVGEDVFKVIYDQEEMESESPGMGMSL